MGKFDTDTGLKGWFVKLPRDFWVLSSGVFNNWNVSVLHGVKILYLVLNFYHIIHLKSHPKRLGNV